MPRYKFLTETACGYYSNYCFAYWLPNSGNAGAGEWLPKVKRIVMCDKGYHYSIKSLWSYINVQMWEVELLGKVIESGEKGVAESIRFIRHVHHFTTKDYIDIMLWCIKDLIKIVDNAPLHLIPRDSRCKFPSVIDPYYNDYRSFANWVSEQLGKEYISYDELKYCLDVIKYRLEGNDVDGETNRSVKNLITYLKYDSNPYISKVAIILGHALLPLTHVFVENMWGLAESLDNYLKIAEEYHTVIKFGTELSQEVVDWKRAKREKLISKFDKKILEIAGEISKS